MMMRSKICGGALALLSVGICSADITSWTSPRGETYPRGSGKVWTVYPENHKPVCGGVEVGEAEMTGPQQLTNAFVQCTAYSLIVVKPGRYDFSGIAMTVDTVDGVSVTNHLCGHAACRPSSGMFDGAIVGDTTGHWGDEVVFTGDGRFCNMAGDWVVNGFGNITFDGFNAGTIANGATSAGAVFSFVNGGDNNCLSNCVLRNCSAYSGGAMYGGSFVDCLVSNNVATGGNAGGAWFTWARFCRFAGNRAANNGGALLPETSWKNVATNEFIRNFAGNRGGALYFPGWKTGYSGGASGCTFRENLALQGGGAIYIETDISQRVEGCDFFDNMTSNSNGGAIWVHGKPRAETENLRLVQNCTFVGNMAYGDGEKSAVGGAIYSETENEPVVDCVFSNNYAWAEGGAVSYCACTNCTFVGNRAVNSGRGAAIAGYYPHNEPQNMPYKSEAYNCVFRDNLRRDTTGRLVDTSEHYEYGGNDGCGVKIVKCDTNRGGFWRCHVEDTVIHHVTNDFSTCVFYEQNFVTNCLIYGCNLTKSNFGLCYRYLYMPSEQQYRGLLPASFVNCTFADNTLHSSYGFVKNDSAGEHQIQFKNCIFSNNRKANGTLADISGYKATNSVVYANCLYGADDGTMPWVDGGNNLVCADAKFVGEKAEKLGAPAYSLRASSPARGRGDASVFGADAHDLAENPRLRDGKLDLGCYQCWLDPVGFLLLCR